jgi:SagB-type dehydrogenase family enzyme
VTQSALSARSERPLSRKQRYFRSWPFSAAAPKYQHPVRHRKHGIAGAKSGLWPRQPGLPAVNTDAAWVAYSVNDVLCLPQKIVMLNRRQFLGVMLMSNAVLAQDAIALPPPQITGTVSLLQALRSRRSSREFSPRPLPLDVLSTLLWSAFGINRPDSGGRTAPSAHNWQEIEVYVALPDAAYRYDARDHALQKVVANDLRAATGMQDFVATAPLNLVYVADFGKMVDASGEDRTFYGSADAGFIAQNAYLYCAAAGLACVVRGLVDRRKLAAALQLRIDQRIILAQTVGYPKQA